MPLAKQPMAVRRFSNGNHGVLLMLIGADLRSCARRPEVR
jgi:hypothetical protein